MDEEERGEKKMRRERRSFTCRLRMPWLHEHTSMQPQRLPHTPALSRKYGPRRVWRRRVGEVSI